MTTLTTVSLKMGELLSSLRSRSAEHVLRSQTEGEPESTGDSLTQDWRSSVFSPTPTFSEAGLDIGFRQRNASTPRNYQPLIVSVILMLGVGISVVVWWTA